MEITIDDETHFALKSNPATVGEALLEITEHVGCRNRVVQTILIDGKNMLPEELTPEFGATLITSIQMIEIRSVEMADIAVEALEEIANVIPELPAACHELAKILSGDDPASAFGQFNQFLDIWEVLKEREAQVVNLLELDLQTINVSSGTVAQHDAALSSHVQRARKCMESSDFPGLSDLLSHDLSELAEIEEEIIAQLKAKL